MAFLRDHNRKAKVFRVRAPDCIACPSYVWKDEEKVRRMTEQERSCFRCPSWCKGHWFNHEPDNQLDLEYLVSQYRLRDKSKPEMDSGRAYLFNLMDALTAATQDVKVMRQMFSSREFTEMRQPYAADH